MKKILVGLIASIVTFSASAAYHAQGCGLGSTIWTDGSSLMHQVLGATTNGTSGNQTFGMTSGTSNCELEAVGRANTVFIEANRVALSNDIARGQGDTLASLARMYGCSNVDRVGPALQQNYERIFPSENVDARHVDMTIGTLIQENRACI
jgi:GH24 family phage-related lysozyme (muramidase)